MDKAAAAKAIQEHIAKGETEKALELLIKYTDELEPSSYDEAMLLSGQYKQWKRDSMLGIQHSSAELRRIEASIMDITHGKLAKLEARDHDATAGGRVKRGGAGSINVSSLLIGVLVALLIGFAGWYLLADDEAENAEEAIAETERTPPEIEAAPPVAPPAAAYGFDPNYTGYYRLQNKFRGETECLESNAADRNAHAGAAYMDGCANVSGQFWRFESAGDGYFYLKSEFRGENECLESNAAEHAEHNGAAYMDVCRGVTGQMWRLEHADEPGYYLLKSRFRGDHECLEGNQADGGTRAGAAFMAPCTGATGQLWKLVKAE